jgi:hypothetical protein
LPATLVVLQQKVNPGKTEDLQLWFDEVNQQIVKFMLC